MPYKAFISYSHAADGKLAPALEKALERFAKPRNRARAFDVFRDPSDLGLNPNLWSSVEGGVQPGWAPTGHRELGSHREGVGYSDRRRTADADRSQGERRTASTC